MAAPLPPTDLNLEIISRTRLLPDVCAHENAQSRTVPLSILDNIVVRWALTSAVWYFERPNGDEGTDALSTDRLAQSLQKTVNSYPQWAGQLHWLPYDLARGQRHGRVAITYGSATDPGLELSVARCSRTLGSLVPTTEERVAKGTWDADSLPSRQLDCPTALALHNTDESAGRPCVSVQLTAFACGGTSIRIRIAHPVADATAMFQFARDWAAVHRAMLAGQPLPQLEPTFDPALVDGAAAGDLKGSAPDSALLDVARSLPMHRFDWWASTEGCPEPMLGSTKVPHALEGADLGPSGDCMPWSEWDITVPVGHYLVYFTPDEVRGMWEDAASQSSSVRVSRFDALLAFVWKLIVRARGLDHDQDLVNMAVTIGARPRLSPPLPGSFLGSPITLARVSLTGEEIASEGALAPAASAIRAAVARFTPGAIGALLHEMAYATNPQRIWSAFLGRRHSIVTSWQNLDPYGLDFGGGAPPRYVDAVMPSMDGCIHVMEAGPATSRNGAGRWYDDPVCLSLHLAKDVMERLLKDPELRKYKVG